LRAAQHLPLALETAKPTLDSARIDDRGWNLVDVLELEAKASVAASHVQNTAATAQLLQAKRLQQKMAEDACTLFSSLGFPPLAPGPRGTTACLLELTQFTHHGKNLLARCAVVA
jgi:hypothetical protein